ncbi:MAG TPA: DegT/DnrJ/EryC1/StrS family aminotransferase [Cyclobacteriaceae bacterium]|nr:DegT/DnrJ/EryC1/StrS family aminotransferase [Cyclobacteriaceae bacterium]
MIEYENLRKLNEPFMREYNERFQAVLESGWFILGKEVQKFEQSFAEWCGSKYCCGVANGLDALVLALRAFNFPAGSEVIVPSNTYIATILSILNCNLKPVLVEPDIRTYNIDPEKISAAITDKTVAMMIVHLYGKCCEMDKIMAICRKHNLRLIEDVAQAHGAKHKGKQAGTFGDYGAFSFYPTKNLGALGDGGSLNTDDEKLHLAISRLRNYGSDKKYYNEVIGVNSRLDEIQAAFLNVKLASLSKINAHKQKLADIYHKLLKSDFIKPTRHPDFEDVFHIYNIRHPKRDALKDYLLKNEIRSEIHYPVAPHKQVAMKGILDNTSYPISEEIHATTLSLPISYFHTESDIERVVEVMNKF